MSCIEFELYKEFLLAMGLNVKCSIYLKNQQHVNSLGTPPEIKDELLAQLKSDCVTFKSLSSCNIL